MTKMLNVKELPEPAYSDGQVTIFHGDALEILKRIAPASIPLTITSPPYNIGKEYEDVKPLDEYVEWTKRWVSLVYEVASSNGAFWLNLGYIENPGVAKAMPLPYLLWNISEFYLVQEVIWNYGAGVAGRKFFSPRNEKLLWYVKNHREYVFDLDAVRDPNVKYPNQKKNGKLKCNPLGKNPTDVWQIPKVTSGMNRSSRERTSHPAQFPVELISRIIAACSNTDDIILDPFVGSGTTLEAAVRLGRKAIGIELNSKYIDTAIARVRRARIGERAISRQISKRKERHKLCTGDLFGD